jgi:hypothetical protein
MCGGGRDKNSKEIPGTVYPLQSCVQVKNSMQPKCKGPEASIMRKIPGEMNSTDN